MKTVQQPNRSPDGRLHHLEGFAAVPPSAGPDTRTAPKKEARVLARKLTPVAIFHPAVLHALREAGPVPRCECGRSIPLECLLRARAFSGWPRMPKPEPRAAVRESIQDATICSAFLSPASRAARQFSQAGPGA